MMPLLVFRERIKKIYQKYDILLVPLMKFLFAFIAFQTLNSEIGYDNRLKSVVVVLVMSLLSAFTPSAIMVLLAAGAATLHIYSVSPILSILILVIMMVLYLLFARYTPRLGYVILAVPVLYVLKIPYTIPILLGIISTPLAIIPMSCGVILYFIFQIVKTAVTMQINMTVEDILQVYTYVIDNLISNKQMIMSVVIFALILLVTYFVRRMRFDYAFEISVAAGALTGLLGFLISFLFLGKTNQIFSMILGIVASGAIAFIVNFFKVTLDYSGAERVQFEDDVYYYYVKAVPKVTVTTPQKNVKHINVKNEDIRSQSLTSDWNDTDAEEYDEDEDVYPDNNGLALRGRTQYRNRDIDR